MTTLWFAPKAKLYIMEAISSVGGSTALEDQFTFVSQVTQDTAAVIGMSTLGAAGDDNMLKVGQSFTADGAYVEKITAYVGYNGTPTDTIRCRIHRDDSNKPGTTIVTSSDLYEDGDLTGGGAATTFNFVEEDFNEPLKLGVKYWVVFDRTGSAHDTNNFDVYYKGTASTVASHTLARYDSAWTVDASGYDMYHVVYAGGILAKDVRISGGERDAESLKLIGYNELMDEKRASVIEYALTAVYTSAAISGLLAGAPQTVTGQYYRTTGGEKSSNDRTKKAVMVRLYDGTTYKVFCCLNNAVVTSGDFSLAADGHAEQTITAKGLASEYYEEDNYAD